MELARATDSHMNIQHPVVANVKVYDVINIYFFPIIWFTFAVIGQ